MKIALIATFKDFTETGLVSGRTVGYFPTQKAAVEAVENNSGDIHENCYKYAVVERVEPGLYQYDLNPTFFEWKDGKYVKIKRPDEVRNIAGFTIG